MQNGKTLSVREAAAELRVGVTQVYTLLWDGRLRAQKIDGQWRISKDSVQERLREKGLAK